MDYCAVPGKARSRQHDSFQKHKGAIQGKKNTVNPLLHVCYLNVNKQIQAMGAALSENTSPC